METLLSIHPSCHGDERYFFELINLKGVQPYALIRGPRQFGQVQVIPLRSDMDHNNYEFGQNDPEVHNILRRWERVIFIDTGISLSFYIVEYYMWILKEAEGRELSEEGYYYGLTDERENILARNLWNFGYKVTPYTRGKMAPSSWDRYL